MITAVNKALSGYSKNPSLKRSHSERKNLPKQRCQEEDDQNIQEFEMPFSLPQVGDFQQIFPFNKVGAS